MYQYSASTPRSAKHRVVLLIHIMIGCLHHSCDHISGNHLNRRGSTQPSVCTSLALTVVTAGRGMKNGENFELLYTLADKLNAAGTCIYTVSHHSSSNWALCEWGVSH